MVKLSKEAHYRGKCICVSIRFIRNNQESGEIE